MRSSQKKNKQTKKQTNTHFWIFWAKKGQICIGFGQNGENYQNSAWNIFLLLTSPNCKVSEKSNERFPRKRVRPERTHEKRRLLRFPTTVGQETKKV